MWVPIVVHEDGSIESLVADFREVAQSSRDMTEPLTVVIKRILTFVGRQYTTEGTAAGYAWPRLTDKYREWKESKVPGLPILFGVRRLGPPGQRPQTYGPSGRMIAASTDPASTTVGPKRAIYRPLTETLGWHQFGTQNMPARPPVLFSPREEAEWPHVFLGWIDAQIVAAGL